MHPKGFVKHFCGKFFILLQSLYRNGFPVMNLYISGNGNNAHNEGVMDLRRWIAAFLCICFLCIPVQGTKEEKLVALTFDDGPSGRYTRALLDGLAQRGQKATFFLCGYRIAEDPLLTQRIFQEGHEIGLHGYSHKPLNTMSQNQILQELEHSASLLPEGCQPVFLRCPGGLCNKRTKQAAEEFGVALAHWSVDPRDWATSSAATVEKEVLNRIKDGDVILMHDMSSSSVEAAMVIVDTLVDQGFRFVTLSELAMSRDVFPAPGTVYYSFPQKETIQ